jgi:hypothetical protein
VKIKLIAILSLLLFCTSCKNEIGPYSNVPKLNYEGYSVIKGPSGRDSIVRVTIKYQDGDGDLGLSDADTFPPHDFGSPHYNNLIVDMYREVNGNLEYVVDAFGDTVNLSQRFPILTPDGPDKAISGTMVFYFETKPFGVTDSLGAVKYSVFIYDRALNTSNLVETPIISIDN